MCFYILYYMYILYKTFILEFSITDVGINVVGMESAKLEELYGFAGKK